MSSVLKRKLFMQPPVKKASGGILSIVEEGEEEDSYEDRTPENLEIITNNLRGDVRSMDERYNELAEMVGEEQAAQTPPEVLALLQTKLAPQQPMPPVPAAKANGIAGLMGGGQQPPMPGQPPQGVPQPPMPGQPPMPPQGAEPPMPAPVQRQKGSPPSGEYTREKGAGTLPGGGMRIDITGVAPQDENTQPRALTPETVGPVTRIPEVIPTTTAPRMGGMSGFAGSQPAQQGPSALDVYNMESAQAAPPLKSATDFVEGYASQGGDLQDLAKYLSQPEPDFQESNNALGNYLQDLSKQQAPSASPAQTSGIESLVNEPQAPTIPQEDLSTIEDISRDIGQQTAPQEAPAQAPQEAPAQAPQEAPAQGSGLSMPSISGDALAGIGAALAIGGLLGKAKGGIKIGGLGGSGSGGSDTTRDDYLRLLAFASPHRMPGGETKTDAYLDTFGKMPGGETEVDNMVTGLSNLPSKSSDVEVFPVKPSNIGVKSLAPQQPVQRSKGSTPVGERVEPSFGGIKDVVGQNANGIRANDPFNLPGRGVQPMPPVPEAFVNPPTSRPLTQAELAERIAAGERRTMSPATRTLYELSRQMGIDPNILTDRLNKFSKVLKKVPGVGKLFKGKEAAKLLAADLGVAGTATATGIGLLRSGEDGASPPTPPSQFGVEQIPTEFDTAGTPGEPAPPTPPSPPDASTEIGGPVDLKALTREVTPGSAGELDVTPVDTFEYDENILKEQQAAEQYAPGAERDTSGPALEAAAAQEGDDAYAAAVRKRAKVYQDLLGDNKEDRQMKAYLLLAEAGLKMMTGKGRNTAEIIAGGLQGLPSGLGAIASESEKIKRAATAAAISDINAQKLQETKSAATLAAAVARQQASQRPRNQKIMGNFNLLTQHYGFPADNPLTGQVATGLVDGTITTDKRGNLRGPTGEVIPRFGYGPANQPLKQDEVGFLQDNNPFLQSNPSKPTPIVDEKRMMETDEEVYKLQKTLGYIQAAKKELGNVVGPMNVIQRGISSVTQPILGDLGPFTAFQASRGNVVDRANRAIQEAVSLNTNRVSVYEQEKNRKLEIDKNSFFNSPQIELGRILRFETELINEINKLKYQLNPEGGLKQMDVPPLGTEDEPLPTEAFSALGEYFQGQPNAKVYWTDEKGKVHALTKQQYLTGMKTQ